MKTYRIYSNSGMDFDARFEFFLVGGSKKNFEKFSQLGWLLRYMDFGNFQGLITKIRK